MAGRAVVDPEGREWPDSVSMCRAWGVAPGTYAQRRRRGWSLADALGDGLRVADHEGGRFASVEAMCRAWGVPAQVYRRRLAGGWSQADALAARPDEERCLAQSAAAVTDPEGRPWPSVAAMCRAWGVPRTRYYSRLAAGWDQADALTLPAGASPDGPVTDPDGRHWPDVAAMCRAWGASPAAYMRRVARGEGMREALEGRPSPRGGMDEHAR